MTVALTPDLGQHEALLARFIVDFWAAHGSEVSPLDAVSLLAEWTADDHRLFVILADDVPVGFIRTHFSSETVCWIDDLYVDAARRGQGIATQAIHLAEDTLRSQGARSFCMEVVPDNLPAMRLYHHLGYDRLSLVTLRKDDEPFEAVRTEHIATLPLRVKGQIK